MASLSAETPTTKKTKVDPVDHLRSLPVIRERCTIIYEAARRDELKHFSLDEDKLGEVTDYVNTVIESRFPDGINTVPFHSRFRHFEPGGVDRLAQLRGMWSGVDQREQARRLVDLVTVSVLLDAGAGDAWKYQEADTGITLSRSEGLGVASYHMFLSGAFSSNPENPHQVDAAGLKQMANDAIRTGFQVETRKGPMTPRHHLAVDDATNPLVGADSRAELLRSLGGALEGRPEYFSNDSAPGVVRPGHLIDYLSSRADEATNSVSVHDLWSVIMYGLEAIWPAGRTQINGRNMGDVWPHSALPIDPNDGSSGYVPFHKLSQWLGYSLLEPIQEAGLTVKDTHHMTGLPEYRNGGLFVDLGALVPKDESILTISHKPESEVIVEWRALTVILLDEVARRLREKLELTVEELPLVKILEGGTWTAGRKIAKEKRPETGGPPITIISDGTVF